MKSLIKYSLVLLAAFSLGACGVAENTTSNVSYGNISTIYPNSFLIGSEVSREAFDSEANKITEYKTPKVETLNYEFRETLKGSWYMATDNKGNRLPDGTDIYASIQKIFDTTDSGRVDRNRDNNLPTNAMKTFATSTQPNTLKNWISYLDSTKQSHDKNPDYMPGYEEKFCTGPLRMYFKTTTARVGDGTTIDGTYSHVEEFDITFREDGYVDTFFYKEILEVDGTLRQGMESIEQVKCTYTMIEKCTVQYTFE